MTATIPTTEGWDELSEEEKETRIQNKSGELMGTGARDQHTTRNNIAKRAWGNIKDFGNQMVGNYQDHSGFLEKDENGKPAGFKDRTCFVAGTLVMVTQNNRNVKEIDGKYYKEIQDVEVGDEVVSKSDQTGEVSSKRVIHKFVREAEAIYIIHLKDGTELETTWNHPFRIVKDQDFTEQAITLNNTQWLKAELLESGYKTISSSGKLIEIEKIEIEERKETVYNFEVEDFHTYYVGEIGVWVHNDDMDSYLRNEVNKTVDTAIGKTEDTTYSLIGRGIKLGAKISQSINNHFSGTERQAFNRFWNGNGSTENISKEEFETLARAAKPMNQKKEPQPTKTPGIYSRVYDVYNNKDLDFKYGRFTAYTDSKGTIVGMRDNYNFDPKPWGERGYVAEIVTMGVAAAASIVRPGRAPKSYDIKYGNYE